MLAQVLSMRYVGHGQWGRPDDTDPPRWKSGAPVCHITVTDADGAPRQMTIAEDVDPDALGIEVGEFVDLVCSVTPKQEVVFRRDGSERIVTRDKWRVTSLVSAPLQTAAA